MRRDGDEELTQEDLDGIRASLAMNGPDVVAKPGRYNMRCGVTATVVRTNGPFPYSCSGRNDATGVTMSWAPSGRFRASGEHPFDIVSPA